MVIYGLLGRTSGPLPSQIEEVRHVGLFRPDFPVCDVLSMSLLTVTEETRRLYVEAHDARQQSSRCTRMSSLSHVLLLKQSTNYGHLLRPPCSVTLRSCMKVV